MSKRISAVGAPRRGTSKSRAVAGTADIRKARQAPARFPGASPSRDGERRWGHARRAGQQRRCRAADSQWAFHIDMPETVPVLPAELAALEAHLGAAIESILSGKG